MPDSSDFPRSGISHISIGTNDYPRADAVLATLQIGLVMEHGESAAYGQAFPESGWGGRMTVGRPRRACHRQPAGRHGARLIS